MVSLGLEFGLIFGVLEVGSLVAFVYLVFGFTAGWLSANANFEGYDLK